MNITKLPRLLEIDVAKGLGIVFVVLGHNWLFINHYSTLNQAIYTFHVPLFFFLSGLMFKQHDNISFLMSKRLTSLLKPYFIVLILFEFYRFVTEKSVSISPFLGILYATGQSISITSLWFLPHLFIVILVVNTFIKFLQDKLSRYSFNILIVGILIIGVLLLHFLNSMALYGSPSFEKSTDIPLGHPFSIDLLLISVAFFLSGYINSDVIKRIKSSYLHVILSVVIFIITCLFFDPRLDLNSRIYDDFLSTSVAAFTGIWMVISISKAISKHLKYISLLLSYIGSASLYILIFHGIVQGVLAHKFNLWFPGYVYLSIFLSAGLSIIISCILFNFSNLFPRFRSIIQ